MRSLYIVCQRHNLNDREHECGYPYILYLLDLFGFRSDRPTDLAAVDGFFASLLLYEECAIYPEISFEKNEGIGRITFNLCSLILSLLNVFTSITGVERFFCMN